MSINYNSALKTYIAQDVCGCVLGIYDPACHGSVDEFRTAMAAANAA